MTDEKNLFGVGEFGGQFGSAYSANAMQIITDTMTMTGINADNTRYRIVVLAFLNEVYLTILKGRHWKFMNKELFRETFDPKELGAVDIVGGEHDIVHTEVLDSNNLAIISTPFNSNYLNQMFHLQSSDEYYRIIEVLGQDKLKVHSGVAADTATNQSFRILNDRLTLDAKVQAIRSLIVVGEREIKPCGLQDFRNRKSFHPTLTGTPQLFTVIGSEAQDGRLTLELYPSPDKRYSLHIEYTERPTRLEDSESCFLVIPPEHIDVVTLAVRTRIYQDQNNVPMSTQIGKEAASAWNRMAGDQEMTDSVAGLKHSRNYFQRNRNRYRGFFGLKHFGKVDD